MNKPFLIHRRGTSKRSDPTHRSIGLPENKNPHVYRMARFLPFDPSHDQIYEEYQTPNDSLNLDTVAFSYVLEAAKSGADVIVLTGDAGHGKTHLCRRIIQALLGYDEDEARKLINEHCDGRTIIEAKVGASPARNMRVFKDFSEFAPDIAADLVERSSDDGVITVICANEGRLRAVLSSELAGPYCARILKSFEVTFEDGKASRDGRIHVVNLNNQSIAAGTDGQSLGDLALHKWTDGRRWGSCMDCDARDGCPINLNRELLSEATDKVAGTRKAKLRILFATLERIGYVITIRDMLMAFAYLLTGGLKCEDVHRMLHRRRKGWQPAYAFYNLAFAIPDTLSKEQLRRLPLIEQLPKLDPGRRAIREVDECIINQQGIFLPGQLDLQFPASSSSYKDLIDAADGIDEIIGDPRNKKERYDESQNVRCVVRALRRRAYFDGVNGDQLAMANLGFPYGADFLNILNESLDVPARTLLKRRVIAGLHHIQGLQFSEPTPTLHLVDPAFGRSMSGTAILAARIKPSNVDLLRLSDKWGNNTEVSYHVKSSVDWSDRHVVLRIVDDKRRSHDLLIDLMTFDCILRAAAGHVPSKFYEHDIRRVIGFLGRIAQSAARSSSDQINLVRNGRSQTISIDGTTIQVGVGA